MQLNATGTTGRWPGSVVTRCCEARRRGAVDKISQAHWETCFENRYIRDQATAFHEFFWAVMERRYPDDFQRVVPWGQIGDLKNDGYVASRRFLFQCYGPKVM